jgi:hypothetical protein
MSSCSTDGRAMMGIDLQGIIQMVEGIAELKVNSQLLKLTEVLHVKKREVLLCLDELVWFLLLLFF